VSKIQFESLSVGVLTSFAKAIKFVFDFFWCPSIGIAASMQFDGFHAQLPGFLDLSHVRINKQTAHNSSALKLIDALADSLEVSLHIQSALGRNLFASSREQGSPDPAQDIQGDLCDLVGDRHFQIQADTADFFQ
jgi:hypothetical protein